MRIIPAIDLKNGCVVRAAGGDRKKYKPLCTKAFPSSALLEVIEKLRPHHDLFYIADLDVIGGTTTTSPRIAELTAALPQTKLWLDLGIRREMDYQRVCADGFGTPVVGSETLTGIETLSAIARVNKNYILSLDFIDRRLRGSDELLDAAELWPSTVIVLALDAVGSGQGPDLFLCEKVRSIAGDRNIVYGGGIRTRDDLRALEDAGMNDVLLARAIYEGEAWTRGDAD